MSFLENTLKCKIDLCRSNFRNLSITLEYFQELKSQTGVEAGIEQAASWAKAAFRKTNKCESISLRA